MGLLALLLALVAVSAAQKWRIVNHNVATIDLGLFFASCLEKLCFIFSPAQGVAFISETVGYTAGTLNGAVSCSCHLWVDPC